MLVRFHFEEEFFRAPCFRLESPIIPADLDELNRQDASALFAHAKISSADLSLTQQLAASGFSRICTQVELGCPVGETPPATIQAEITDRLTLTPEEIVSHALNLHSSRYRLDPAIAPEIALALIRKWVALSTGGAKRVASIGANFLSFSDAGTVRTIDLVSSLEKRRGYATALVFAALRDAWQCGCKLVRVTTDETNEAALKIYRRAGFATTRTLDVYHLYRPPAGSRSHR
jgi:GNAT superfamily N-acetyltransferase